MIAQKQYARIIPNATFRFVAMSVLCLAIMSGCGRDQREEASMCTILLILDGMACGTLEKIPVPNIKALRDQGVYYPTVHLILPAHLEQNSDTADPAYYPWGCSLPNIPLMTGTIFVGMDGLKENMIQHSFTNQTTAFVVNDGAYEELRHGFDIYHRYGSGQADQVAYEEVLDVAKDIILSERPAFMRIHWQGPGSAGYQDMNDGVSIWDDRSNYRREIMRADTTVGNFVAWLKDNGLWGATTLFVMGDHGQNDEGWHAPYVGQAQRQPVIICGNGIKEGKEYSYAEAVDVCTTIAHLHGVPKPKFSQGRVLTEALQGQPDTAPDRGTMEKLNALLLEHHALMDKISDAQKRQIANFNRQFYTIESMGSWHRHFESVEALLSHQEDVLTAMKNMIGS